MLKVCLDTNIWVSGVAFNGTPAKVVTLAFKRKFQVISSLFILEELRRNLPHFGFSKRNINILCNRIAQLADMYEPRNEITIVEADPTDNLVLETAWYGNAKYLVTGDTKHLLPLKKFKYTKIVTAKEFLEFYNQ